MSKWLATLAFLGTLSSTAWAHDPGLSSATVTIGERDVSAVATFNARDLRVLSPDNGSFSHLAADVLHLAIDGRLLTASLTGLETDHNENVTFRLSYSRPQSGTLAIASGLIGRLPFGHRQLLTVRTADGAPVSEYLLHARENELFVPLAPTALSSPASRFSEFFLLGIRHILTGYDHLLFLFGLLIVCRSARSAALLITCFTVAHSLTLALATFGIVNLQSRFVEPAIAASIVFVGIENIFRGGTAINGRWAITFAFGLIHGLGFASVLREMGIAASGAGAAVPLFAFNLGVEAGQLSVAAIAVPIIAAVSRRPVFVTLWRPACSVLVALAGGYWLLERTVFS